MVKLQLIENLWTQTIDSVIAPAHDAVQASPEAGSAEQQYRALTGLFSVPSAVMMSGKLRHKRNNQNLNRDSQSPIYYEKEKINADAESLAIHSRSPAQKHPTHSPHHLEKRCGTNGYDCEGS